MRIVEICENTMIAAFSLMSIVLGVMMIVALSNTAFEESYESTIHRQAECIRALSGMDDEARATFCDEEVE